MTKLQDKIFKIGDICRVTGDGDLFCIDEAREFINAECTFIKVTKSGLIHVALTSDKTKKYSVPLRNIRTRDGLAVMSNMIT